MRLPPVALFHVFPLMVTVLLNVTAVLVLEPLDVTLDSVSVSVYEVKNLPSISTVHVPPSFLVPVIIPLPVLNVAPVV